MESPTHHKMEIAAITALQVYDSRGNPTIETTVRLRNGVEGVAIVPSGASVGKYEALELRDGISEKFLGRSVYKAIRNVNQEIHDALRGKNVCEQEKLDQAYRAMKWAAMNMPQSLPIHLNFGLAAKRAGYVDEARALAKRIREQLGANNDFEQELAEIEA